MKKISIILASLFGVLTLTTSCNDEWTEEQYEKYVSFKSPLNDNGVSRCYVPFTRHNADGSVKYGVGISDYQLPVIVSGSTTNGRDVTVSVAPSDTLKDLNFARFQNRKDLWYKDMTPWAKYPETVTIPAGQDIGLLNIRFDFKQADGSIIDMVEKWVLPIQVVDEGKNYEAHPRKHYAKAMLRVYPFNNYSGDYSATSFKIATSLSPEDPIGMKNSRAYVYDEDAVFFYMGNVDETNMERGLYKIYARFIPGYLTDNNGNVVTDENGEPVINPNAGKVQMWTDEETRVNTNFAWTGQELVDPEDPTLGGYADFRIEESADGTLHYMKHHYVIISKVSYKYDDYTLLPPERFTYLAGGSLTLERQINTQIPDEDQAFVW